MNPIFPKSADRYFRIGLIGVLAGAGVATALGMYLLHPQRIETGYTPRQPVPYSHKLHAGNLGMDCRYCHTAVETAAHANIPATETCMNCHTTVRKDSPLLEEVRESYSSGQPIPWVRVHKLPDYVYFNHSAHVNAGVSCASCHGRVDQMVEVKQVKPLTMAWCLECHRDPAPNIRPKELVTRLDWKPAADPRIIGAELVQKLKINPPTNCSGCHR
jgi:hypothetical protein